MLLFNRLPRRSVTALICVLAGLLLAGCFRPMLAERSDGTSVNSDLSQVYIELQDTRIGQQVRNDLVYAFASDNSAAAYRLSISLEVKETGALVQPSTRVRGKTISINAVYTLTDAASGEVIHGGTAFSRASFDASTALFANERAALDAENRAAGIIADDIRTRISAWLAANPSPNSSS